MTIPDICKLHSQNMVHNLRLAKTDDERLNCLSSALKAFGEQIIPPLNQLVAEHFERTPEFDSARTAALELATVICGDFVRKCTDYSWGVAWLEKVSYICKEQQLKQKLVFYTSQLKKRWNVVEQGVLTHNHQTTRIWTVGRSKSLVENCLGLCLFLALLLFFLTRIDLTALIFPAMNKPQQSKSLSQVQVVNQEEKSVQQPQYITPPQPAKPVGALYSFADSQGVVHMVDDYYKVPLEYRSKMKVDSPSSSPANSTPVFITGNQVVVPVTITFRGRSVETRLLLDTGATVTTISEALATQLGISSSDVQAASTRIADGRSIASYIFKADSLAVANHLLSNENTSILPGTGGKGYEGLLGMNYLKNFRYHVNFVKSVIEWDS